MTENTRQIDPHNPGPTVSVAAITNALVGVGEVIAHVLEHHEVDERGRGDLAVLLLRIATLTEEFATALERDESFMAAVAEHQAKASETVPDDVWAALGEFMSEAEMTEIRNSLGGESGQ